LEKIDAYYI
jgi:hypothetical protein